MSATWLFYYYANMLFTVDHASPLALADQIAGQVRGGLARGEIEPGERLPPARDLATALEVNMHTVLRAYAQLRDEGLIDLRRGRGAVVRRHVSAERIRLTELARAFVTEARRLGLGDDDITALIKEL
ncbi:GntR family transcriptional regulator [Asanoa ferruginea]|uniref:GntR family transcriptional regulator n=2 Tax=Asanoa ferruginea TaxID=53367 RepID=A0A3D9ZPF6_9ACTN|nr:GntR family transcriptional regulator [Asanoa ferruginea]GIF51369.1 GntR family transcriptional regulator [Asanoa ferruginea]